MLYVVLDKETKQPQGTIEINQSAILSEWQSNYDLVSVNETFRGKKSYEIIRETGDQIRLATSQEILDATKEKDFDASLYLSRLSEEFTALERLSLAKIAPSFISELQYKNFAEIKELRDYLLSTEEITQAQANTLTSLFSEQNINLEDYGETGTGTGTGV